MGSKCANLVSRSHILIAMSTLNGLLQEFFNQFNFQGYTYDPHTPAPEEFKRLCQARQWGRWKIREQKTEFLLAVEREQDLRRSLADPNRPLQEFFSQFNFQEYTYDPHTPALEEFKRLCQARQWGASKIREHEPAFLLAIERKQDIKRSLAGPNAPLQESYSQFNFQRYDPHKAATFEEFKRLCQARQQGASKIREHEPAFLLAIEREQDIKRSLAGPNPPLQEFFSQFNFQRYTYDPHKPALEEFKHLCQARQWGPSKIREHEAAFSLAVEREKDLRGSLTGPNMSLQEFFNQFNFERYTYDPPKPASFEEFKRLWQAQKWGPSKIGEHETSFLLAVEGEKDLRGSLTSPNMSLQGFFSQFNSERYTYDSSKPASFEEFKRLWQAQQWGPSKIGEHETSFLLAVEGEKDLRWSLTGPNMSLQEFFNQFNFERYTYDSLKLASFEEFKRLWQAQQWGPSKIGEHETSFLLAVEGEQDLRGSPAGPNAPLQEFFSQFNFREYTYDPHKPPLEEFKRLCQERQWGPSKIREHQTAFLHAVRRGQDRKGNLPGPNVIEFFIRYEYPLFTYNLDASPQSELQRLAGLRKWGEANLSQVTEQFNKAVALDARGKSGYAASESTDSEDLEVQEVDLLVDWMRQRGCCEYRYRGALPELKFRKLKKWELVNEESEDSLSWTDSCRFELLYTEFNQVIDMVFNSRLDKFCQITGFTPWQILAGLYGRRRRGVGKQEAETVCSTEDPVRL